MDGSPDLLEADLITSVKNGFPAGATAAEKLYSLRGAIHFSEQWFPGLPSSHPALILLLAFCVGVDEFFFPTDSLASTIRSKSGTRRFVR